MAESVPNISPNFQEKSGCGKSHLCLQYLLNAQLTPENGGIAANCVYISTESEFSENRLEQFADELINKKIKGFTQFKDFSDNILVNQATTLKSLEEVFFDSLPKVLELNKNIRLVILDSIASIYRVEFGLNDLIQRSDSMFKLAVQMKSLAYKYDFAMVVVNQVSAVFDEKSSEKVQPALGLSWSSCVDTRLMIKKKTQKHPIVRNMRVMFSSYLEEEISCDFMIDNGGITNVSM